MYIPKNTRQLHICRNGRCVFSHLYSFNMEYAFLALKPNLASAKLPLHLG